MAHLGIFSSLFPYIVLVVSYITCLGYFSFNKKGIVEESEAKELFVEMNCDVDAGDHYSYFTDSKCHQKQSSEARKYDSIDFGILSSKNRHICNHSPGKLLKELQPCLFSRPPPSFVC